MFLFSGVEFIQRHLHPYKDFFFQLTEVISSFCLSLLRFLSLPLPQSFTLTSVFSSYFGLLLSVSSSKISSYFFATASGVDSRIRSSVFPLYSSGLSRIDIKARASASSSSGGTSRPAFVNCTGTRTPGKSAAITGVLQAIDFDLYQAKRFSRIQAG